MKKFAKLALGALMVAGAATATTAAMTSPAEARGGVSFSFGVGGPGYYGGYYGPAYYPVYPAYPAYYDPYYYPRPYYYGRPYWRPYRGWYGYRGGWYRGYRHW